MLKLSTLVALSLLPWIPAFLCGVTTVGEHAVLEGESLVIPCHYEPQYATYVKYWCHGKTREFCTSLARTDDAREANPAEDKVSIFDDPVQLVFTVTMNNLKVAEAGWYMCGVEIGGIWKADVVTYTNIRVINGMSVVNSRVSAEEGSNVTAECLYSERYRGSKKKWCRSGDWSSCVQTGSEGSYEDTSVAISDDRTRTFTVTLKKLHLRDSGWYWCSAGQHKIPVQVVVTPRPTTTMLVTSPPAPATSQYVANLAQPKSITKGSWYSDRLVLEPLLVCASLMLLVGMAILVRKLTRLRKPQFPFLEQDPVLRQVKEDVTMINTYSEDDGDLRNAQVIFTNRNSEDTLSQSA